MIQARRWQFHLLTVKSTSDTFFNFRVSQFISLAWWTIESLTALWQGVWPRQGWPGLAEASLVQGGDCSRSVSSRHTRTQHNPCLPVPGIRVPSLWSATHVSPAKPWLSPQGGRLTLGACGVQWLGSRHWGVGLCVPRGEYEERRLKSLEGEWGGN